MIKLIHAMWSQDQGQDIIEYALLAALVSIFAIAAITLIGPQLNIIYNDIVTALTPAP